MVLCIIPGCGVKSGNKEGISLFRIPIVVDKNGESYKQLTEDRRNAWISQISRDDTKSKDILKSERVCGRHFVSGKPALLWDRYNVDWKPTLNLGKKDYSKEPDLQAAAARADRAKDRDQARQSLLKQQQREHEAARERAAKRRKLNESGQQVSKIDFAASSGGERLESDSMTSEIPDFQVQEPPEKEATTQTEGPEQNEAGSQTEEFDYMFMPAGYQAPDQEYFDSDAKVRFYTGLPSYEVLMVVFEHVSSHVSRQTQNLSRFQEFVMVLIKLRLNVPLQDLAYRFVVSVTTVSRIFSYWMVVMDVRLKFMISWPEREQLWQIMPMCFQYAFGKKVTVVIDCFEVFIERPSNLLARAQTFSSYKHHNTIKVLIGITPQGSISFVSEAWGGRTSDKYLTENCGFLEFLVPGDMVMADRGFTISDSVGLKQAKLTIPAFTKRKSQLDPVDVERTRGIANVRIHVERVIGLLRRKYAILQSTLPTDYLTCNRNGPPETQVPIIDRIIRVCSALVNFCPPIVPFD